jgi:hypothetical protein
MTCIIVFSVSLSFIAINLGDGILIETVSVAGMADFFD